LLERRHVAVAHESDDVGVLGDLEERRRIGLAHWPQGQSLGFDGRDGQIHVGDDAPAPPAGAAIIRAMLPPTAPEIERLRSRALATYFTAAALTSIAYIATFTVASLAAPEITGSTGSSGWPSAVAV